MTLGELRQHIDNILIDDPSKNDLRVVISTNNDSVGPSSSANIVMLHEGFDWDSGTVFIHPEYMLVKDNGRTRSK